MKKIIATTGEEAFVDDEDFGYLNRWRWHFREGYLARRWVFEGKEKMFYLHHIVLGVTDTYKMKVFADHINNNRLDNRKENLRLVTRAENNRNVGLRKDNTTGYKGVTWHKASNRYRVQVSINGKSKHFGYFNDLKDAAKKYNEIARKEFGIYARLNSV